MLGDAQFRLLGVRGKTETAREQYYGGGDALQRVRQVVACHGHLLCKDVMSGLEMSAGRFYFLRRQQPMINHPRDAAALLRASYCFCRPSSISACARSLFFCTLALPVMP